MSSLPYPTNVAPTQAAPHIRVAPPHDDWAVRLLFGALHALNTALDERFALADGWERVLDEHLAHTRTAGHGLTLLAWCGAQPVGLMMMDGHTDSPLFKHRYWADLLALYVVPEVRGAGVADRLLAVGAAWVHAQGYTRVQLHVTVTNVRAKRFYAKGGFTPVQEIWRLELGAAHALPPDDPDCEAAYAHGHALLTNHSHLIGGDKEQV